MKLSELKRICEEATPKILDGLNVPTNNALYHHSITPSRVKKMIELLEKAKESISLRDQTNEGLWSGEVAWLKDFNEEFGE